MIRTFHSDDSTQVSPHFNAQEFKCKCGKSHDFKISDDLIEKLEQLFKSLHCSKIIVTSGFRCTDHDKSVGGSGTGQHTLGTAADICCYGRDGQPISSKIVCCNAQDIGFGGIANITDAYCYTHVDVRSGSKWYGDEVLGNETVTDDFYKYFGISKDQQYKNYGIDISYCQPNVNWEQVVDDYAIIQIGGGAIARKKDSMFESHYAGAKSKCIPVGGYWFSRAMNEQESREEADICISLMKGKQFEYPIFLDLETQAQLNLGKATVSKIIRAFLERVESAGYWVGLYTSRSCLSTHIEDDIKSRYAMWVAEWGSKLNYSGPVGVWQYSEKGTVAGIKGDVDLDIAYTDYPSLIKANGLNGYGNPPEPTPQKKTINVEMTVDGVKYGGTLTEK